MKNTQTVLFQKNRTVLCQPIKSKKKQHVIEISQSAQSMVKGWRQLCNFVILFVDNGGI